MVFGERGSVPHFILHSNADVVLIRIHNDKKGVTLFLT